MLTPRVKRLLSRLISCLSQNLTLKVAAFKVNQTYNEERPKRKSWRRRIPCSKVRLMSNRISKMRSISWICKRVRWRLWAIIRNRLSLIACRSWNPHWQKEASRARNPMITPTNTMTVSTMLPSSKLYWNKWQRSCQLSKSRKMPSRIILSIKWVREYK